MKQLLLFTAVVFSYTSFSQTNTMPSSGNVGIGTTTPDCKLQVNGSARIDSTLHVKDSILIENNARVGEDLKVEGQLILANPNTETVLNNNAFLLRSINGEVRKFDVDSIAPLLKKLIYGPAVVPGQALGTCDLAGYLNNPTWQNGTHKIFSPCPEVFVGIGTSIPRVSLDVIGIQYAQRQVVGFVDDPQNTALYFHLKANSTTHSNEAIFLVENDQRRLFQINNDGIVRSREVIVNLQNTWPDYVFEKEYSLMPLSEVESYIHENGHLPNVPTAKTVEENGIELGEMNRILLEKIEELTLHQIALKKEIEALKQAQNPK